MPAEAPKSCGDCNLFDTNRVSGRSFGTTKSGEAPIILGVCRAPMGLLLQARSEFSPCLKPKSFTPKEAGRALDLTVPPSKVVFLRAKPSP